MSQARTVLDDSDNIRDTKEVLHQMLKLVDNIDYQLGALRAEQESLKESLYTQGAQLEKIAGHMGGVGSQLQEIAARCNEFKQIADTSSKLATQKVTGCMTLECLMQHKSEITQKVEAFKKHKNWATLRRDLEAVLDQNSEAYKQMQVAASPYYIGLSEQTQLASVLLCAGLSVDAVDSDERTMLHGAASIGHLQMVNQLLDRGADVDARNRYERTPLMMAARNGNLVVVKRLVQAGADITSILKTPNSPWKSSLKFDNIVINDYLERFNY